MGGGRYENNDDEINYKKCVINKIIRNVSSIKLSNFWRGLTLDTRAKMNFLKNMGPLTLNTNLCFMMIIDCLQKFYLLQVIESIDRGYLVNPQPEQSLQEISSQFNDALRLNPPERNTETKVCACFC